MTRRTPKLLSAAVAVALAGGCTFYTDSINGEPDARIIKQTSGPHYLGDEIELSASASGDPNDSLSSLDARWTAVACNDSQGLDCPFDVDLGEGGVFTPWVLEVTTKRTIKVTLTITDDRGASDSDEVVIEVQNRLPEVELQLQGFESGGSFPLGTWIDILADVSDPDGDELTVDWTLFPPDSSVPGDVGWDELTDQGVPAYRLTPDVEGLWNVRVVVTDSEGDSGSAEIPILVGADRPPCISQIEPAVPGATYVVDTDEAPRRFAVLAVSDDLDPFPAPPMADAFVGEATFRWSIASPDTGGAWAPLTGHAAAEYLIDPANYAPGDQVAIRVEIEDRIPRTLPCDEDDDTCSIDGDSCLQRVTWGVDIR